MDKGGFYNVCLRVGTFFLDADMGEDFLNSQTTSTVGQEPARYMAAIVMNAAGQVIFANYLDSVGCVGAMNLANGNYTAFLTTSLYRSSNDVRIDITNDDTKQFAWGSYPFSISGSGGTVTLDAVGFSALSDASAAAGNTIFRATFHYAPGTQTNLYVAQTCPSQPGSGCASGSSIWLGNNNSGLAVAFYKTVTTHELGHRSMRSLFGVPNNNYAIDATQASCRCDHVTSSNNLHCLQGRSVVTAAQVEGWGQYFAAKTFNDASQSNCTFAYYKEFREDNGAVVAPPMAKSCFNQVRWLNNHCSTLDRGTEFDWMNFYWRLDAKDGWLPGDFAAVYQRACGNAFCTSSNIVPWSTLASFVNAQFGPNAAKAVAFSTQGSNFGVNH